MDKELTPIRTRAQEIRANPSIIKEPLARGAEHAREIASVTMRETKQMMGLT
jgi:tryptophanyl-tRNA synthetase